MNYAPTPAEARDHLRRWSAGRNQLQDATSETLPLAWVARAVQVVLDAELEDDDEANCGMVITDLDAIGDAELEEDRVDYDASRSSAPTPGGPVERNPTQKREDSRR